MTTMKREAAGSPIKVFYSEAASIKPPEPSGEMDSAIASYNKLTGLLETHHHEVLYSMLDDILRSLRSRPQKGSEGPLTPDRDVSDELLELAIIACGLVADDFGSKWLETQEKLIEVQQKRKGE